MNEKLADFRLPNLGANFNSNELMGFLNSTGKGVHFNRVNSDCGKYLTAETGDGMQIWCEVIANHENKINILNVHFKSSTRMKLRLDGWTDQMQNGMIGLAYMWSGSGDTEFPLNIDIVNSGLFANYDSGEFTAQLAAFGHDITLFPDTASLKGADKTLTAESCIPIGAFPVDENDSAWEPDASAIMTGTIKKVKRMTNAYTGGKYYYLLVECVGLKLDVLLKAEDVKSKPVVGGRIHGTFYLTARLFNSRNDDYITPCFSIDVNKILEEWRNEKTKGTSGEPIGNWKHTASQVMPDKSILLTFQNSSEYIFANPKESNYYFRFLHFDMDGNFIQMRRMRAKGEIIHDAFYDNQGRFHVVTSPARSFECTMYDVDDKGKRYNGYKLGDNISKAIINSEGKLFIARDYLSTPFWSDKLVSVYDTDGNNILNDIDNGYCCTEIALDEDENILCYTEPITQLYKLTAAEDGTFSISHEDFPLSRVTGITISQDGSHMICGCDAYMRKDRLFVLTRVDGKYADPKELILPVLIQEDCESIMMRSSAKDRMLLAVNGVQYVFKLENNRCDTLEDLGRIRIEKRTEKCGHFYRIVIDADSEASESSFDRYVKPIIEDMRDLPYESLTIEYNKVRKSDSIMFIQVARNGTNYHLEIAVDDSRIDYPNRIYALPDTDFDTVYETFKTVIVKRGCPDLSEWTDYTETAFKNIEKKKKESNEQTSADNTGDSEIPDPEA